MLQNSCKNYFQSGNICYFYVIMYIILEFEKNEEKIQTFRWSNQAGEKICKKRFPSYNFRKKNFFHIDVTENERICFVFLLISRTILIDLASFF